ncbi:MAG TPA: hypothetical protein PLX06_09835, partial [Fimbriimonadaceae bacterium]|nr:hypothetical protein [Fimbriimonadaceae bacterium]
ACEVETVDEELLRTERIMLGLRLSEGLPLMGLGIPSESVQSLFERGWIEDRDDRLTLTPAGRHWCSEAALALI